MSEEDQSSNSERLVDNFSNPYSKPPLSIGKQLEHLSTPELIRNPETSMSNEEQIDQTSEPGQISLMELESINNDTEVQGMKVHKVFVIHFKNRLGKRKQILRIN